MYVNDFRDFLTVSHALLSHVSCARMRLFCFEFDFDVQAVSPRKAKTGLLNDLRKLYERTRHEEDCVTRKLNVPPPLTTAEEECFELLPT